MMTVKINERGNGAVFTIDGKEYDVYVNSLHSDALTVTIDGPMLVLPESQNSVRLKSAR